MRISASSAQNAAIAQSVNASAAARRPQTSTPGKAQPAAAASASIPLRQTDRFEPTATLQGSAPQRDQLTVAGPAIAPTAQLQPPAAQSPRDGERGERADHIERREQGEHGEKNQNAVAEADSKRSEHAQNESMAASSSTEEPEAPKADASATSEQAPSFTAADRDALLAAFGASTGEQRFSSQYDLNGDGRIGSADLADLVGRLQAPPLSQTPPQSNPQDPVNLLLSRFGATKGDEKYDARLDVDGDGRIGSSDLADFIGRLDTSKPSTAPSVAQTSLNDLLSKFGAKTGDAKFDSAYDLNSDGVINSTDLASLVGGQPLNNTAQTTRQEQLQRLLDAFGSRSGDARFRAAFDANGDGAITSADLADFIGRA